MDRRTDDIIEYCNEHRFYFSTTECPHCGCCGIGGKLNSPNGHKIHRIEFDCDACGYYFGELNMHLLLKMESHWMLGHVAREG